MTDTAAQDLIDTLDDLLDTERTALLAGDIDGINRLADQKELVFDRLNALTDVAQSKLEPLQTKVLRNQKLISSALEGIRAVADRMAEMRSVKRSLQTYDKSGTIREIVSEPEPTVEKRA